MTYTFRVGSGGRRRHWRGRGRRPRLHIDAAGRYFKTKWPKGWKPRRYSDSAAAKSQAPKTPWKRGRGGRRYAVGWLYIPWKCWMCGEVRGSTCQLRMMVSGRRAGGKRWWVRSRIVKPQVKRRLRNQVFNLDPVTLDAGRIPTYFEELNSPPERQCQCLPSMRLPSGLYIMFVFRLTHN